MKVLVLGSGGREHAIVWALRQTAATPLKLYCAPGNAGIAQLARCVPISVDNHASLVEFVRSNAIDLTFVGPEAPLAAGIVDEFQKQRLRIVGPNTVAARLEGSKAFAKDFMARHGVATAHYRTVRAAEDVAQVLASGEFGAKDHAVVIKADGLAAGKGVVVARSHREAAAAATQLVNGELIAREAASQIVIEEALVGTEVSLLLFADGIEYKLMPPARDHKRIGENDTGPNTGGMGAITDLAILPAEVQERVVREIVEPTLAGARAEGFPFRGVLFLGLMLTDEGPRLLEYNVRFGDPETQAILVRLRTSLVDIFDAICTGKLREVKIEWSDDSSACVVLASRGYPGKYEKGTVIKGLDSFGDDPTLQVFHAGTEQDANGEYVTAGGRVLGVTATASTLGAALDRCYEGVGRIFWEGMQYRRDIGRFKARGGTAFPE
jgi:phosphoribosylamine--glycine ligase